jgi:hypothetical protein
MHPNEKMTRIKTRNILEEMPSQEKCGCLVNYYECDVMLALLTTRKFTSREAT